MGLNTAGKKERGVRTNTQDVILGMNVESKRVQEVMLREVACAGKVRFSGLGLLVRFKINGICLTALSKLGPSWLLLEVPF